MNGVPRPPSLSKRVLEDGTDVWTTERGEVRAAVRAPGVVVLEVIGHSDERTYPLMIAKVEQEIAAGRQVSWFGDYERMTSFDPGVRALLAKFTKDNRKHFAVIGILLRSRLVALGVAVANVMVGGFIKVFTARRAYERALGESVGRRPEP